MNRTRRCQRPTNGPTFFIFQRDGITIYMGNRLSFLIFMQFSVFLINILRVTSKTFTSVQKHAKTLKFQSAQDFIRIRKSHPPTFCISSNVIVSRLFFSGSSLDDCCCCCWSSFFPFFFLRQLKCRFHDFLLRFRWLISIAANVSPIRM